MRKIDVDEAVITTIVIIIAIIAFAILVTALADKGAHTFLQMLGL